ncbi:class I SAM-dependent methyltransferase [Bacillus sp. Marseille-Q3570]|uniref:class I SAM-dependent methyltransferase n=1 Tax=Bacillus sp. Marseille-Q3570 TaxID=2963522 RepID=UPI0021B71407|nr:class I SAM-dependent methyltransferase [Bacillus sp. Marseille-Q3570]
MGLLKRFALQFRMPHGVLGRFAGFLMAKGGEKSRWTVSLLNPARDDHALEVGFGPGVGIEALADTVDKGYIAGIDISEVMLKQASDRNREAISKGLVDLRLADVSSPPPFDTKFSHIMSVNNIIFWEEPVLALKKLRELMKPNGKIVITMQPLMKGANDETVKEVARDIEGYLTESGFSEIEFHYKKMRPVNCVCVIAVNS